MTKKNAESAQEGVVRPQDYLDYRDFLRDFFEAKKAANTRFSHRVFANQAGLGSPSYLLMVIARKRNLSTRSLELFADGMHLSGRDRVYFECLVRYDQEHRFGEKSRLFSQLLKMRASASTLHRLEKSRFDFLSRWYVVATYVLVGLPAFRPDPEWIAKILRKKITPKQARQALELLQRLELVAINGEKWAQSQGAITVGDDTRALAVSQYHEALIKLGYEALKQMPIERREMAGATISIPSHRLTELKDKIRAFRKDVNSWSSEFQDSDQVFQFNMQLFSLTDIVAHDATSHLPPLAASGAAVIDTENCE